MSDTKKYYWLKLKRDFFKRHDIKIIESMDNGKDYVLFYLKLLLESVDHEGELRFSETIPYNDKMLATITDTNIDIVRSAVKIFSELKMMDRFDDGTLYMEQVNAMLGYETSDAIRMRESREKKRQLLITHGESEQCSESFKKRSPELELDIDKELEKDNKEEAPNKSAPKQYFQKPSLGEITESSKTSNGISQNSKPIPDSKPVKKHCSKQDNIVSVGTYAEIESAYLEAFKTAIPNGEPILDYGAIRRREKTVLSKLPKEKILLAIERAKKDPWIVKQGFSLMLILMDNQLNKLLNGNQHSSGYPKPDLKVNQRTTMLDLEE